MPSRVNLDGVRDPDALEKDRAEARWANGLAGVLSDQYDDLAGVLDPSAPANPPADWWEKWRLALVASLGVGLLDLSHAAAQSAVERYGIGVDWDAVLQSSQQWATQYSYELVRGINATSQAALQRMIQQYYSGSVDYDTLLNMLASQYGPTRAASIAATEVTRGFEQGVEIYQQELGRMGIQADRIWYTVDGGCPICRPFHGRLKSEGWSAGPPPVHPNCKCYTEVVVLPGGSGFAEWNQ